jgi:hypothetical protein
METPDPIITTWVSSPSQLVDYLSCPRKWYFKRIAKLPVEETQSKWDYGHTLHEVCERYVAADERGRDATGEPVDIYPPDWNHRKLPTGEAKLIQVTVEKATEGAQQVLRRMPGREVEVDYKRDIIDGVKMHGKIDVLHNTGLEDHKTTGSRRWVSSQKDLAADDKMLCYAHETVLRWFEEEGKLDPSRTVNMRFNYFSKDAGDVFVKHVDVDVRADEVVEWWERVVVPAAEDMLRMKIENTPVEEWCSVEGARSRTACRDYGGCDFAQVCTRVKTPAKYRKQIDRINESRNKNQSPTPSTMSVFKNTKKRKGGTVAKTDTVSSNPSKQPRKAANKTEAEASVALDKGDDGTQIVGAPWARPGCKACSGTGIREGQPCEACDKINGATGKVTSADFEIVYTEEGTLVYAGELGTGEITLTPVEEVEVKEIPAKPSKEVKVEDADAKDRAYEEGMAEELENDAKAAKKKAANAKRAATRAANKAKKEAEQVASADEGDSTLDVTPEFPEPTDEAQEEIELSVKMEKRTNPFNPLLTAVLYINCLPVGEKTLDLGQVLREEGADLAKEMGKESYYDIVAYERRSLLASCAGEVVAELTGPITVQTGDQDIDSYLAAVRPFFAMVVVGTR